MRRIFFSFLALAFALSASAQSTDSLTNTDDMSREDLIQTIGSLHGRLATVTSELQACAQREADRLEAERFEKIWGKKKYWQFSYVTDKLVNKDVPDFKQLKSKWGVSIVKGRTIAMHKRPIADILKIGLDVNLPDITFAQYKKGNGIGLTGLDWDADDDYKSKFRPGITRDADDYGDGYGYDDDDDEDFGVDLDLGTYQIEVGLGIGPNIQVAPFYHYGHGLEYLKAFTFFHVTPSYSLILQSEDGDAQLNHGYATFFNFGIGLTYKSFSLGFETRSGSGKYKMAELDMDDMENLFGSKSDKMKFKTTSSRIFLRINM